MPFPGLITALWSVSLRRKNMKNFFQKFPRPFNVFVYSPQVEA